MHKSPYPSVEIPSISLPSFVLDGADDRRHKTAIVDGLSGRLLTYGDVLDASVQTAAGFAARGLSKGDVVAIHSPNTPEYPVAVYGAVLAGGVVTTINALLTPIDVAHQLKDSGAKILITSGETLPTARTAARTAGVSDLYVFGAEEGETPFSALRQPGGSVPNITVDPREDVAAVLYSSATTGLSKGVMLTHYNLVANILQTVPLRQMDGREVVVAVLPFHHVYGFNTVMNMTLHAGATLVTLPRFELEGFLDVLERYAVTTAYLVPPIVRALARHPLVGRYDLSKLRRVVSGAAPMPESTARAFTDRIGCVVEQAYGLTETSPVTHFSPPGHVKPASVGVAIPNTEFRVVDVATQQDVPSGELGEVWVRGPQVMKGYLNNPEITCRIIDAEGWLHTGDIGYADRDGYLYVLDRAKDLVKFKGLQYRDDELLLQMVEDLTTRRRDEERLRFQALLLDSVTESVVGVGTDHRVSFWNRGATELFGYTSEEALGTPVASLIILDAPGARRQWQDELSQVADRGRWQGQVRRRRKDGSAIWTDLVVSVVKTPEGQVSGMIAIHRDITELRTNQEMLRDSHSRLQDLTKRLMDVREQERTAIARELHDELGQALTRLTMDLTWLTERVPKRFQTRRVASMLPLVDGMLTTVQHLSSQLRPAILDDLGLEAAIEWQAQEFERWNPCRCMLDLQVGALTPDRDRDTAVFRILQESLTNAARHARATTIRIRGALDAGQLVLEIEDDGVGIPTSEIRSPHSLGLLGMRERARGIGGVIEIGRSAGHGTAISLHVPLASVPVNKRR